LVRSKQLLISLMNRINNNGERGSPCFTPRETSNSSEYDILLAFLIQDVTFLNIDFIIVNILQLRPEFTNFIQRASCITVSKAFS